MKPTYEELEAMVAKLSYCLDTGLLNQTAARAYHESIEPGKVLVLVDIGSLHNLNHSLGYTEANGRMHKSVLAFRSTDLGIRWGGDEYIAVVDKDHVAGLVRRICRDLVAQGLYAVIVTVEASHSLTESFQRADAILSAKKLWLEQTGRKLSRDATYVRCKTIVIRKG